MFSFENAFTSSWRSFRLLCLKSHNIKLFPRKCFTDDFNNCIMDCLSVQQCLYWRSHKFYLYFMSKLVVFICIKNITNINCKYCKQYCGHNKNNLSEKPHRLGIDFVQSVRIYNQQKFTLIFPQL